METLSLGVGGASPNAIFTLLHVVAFAKVYLHFLGIGSLNTEDDTRVGQYTWILSATKVPLRRFSWQVLLLTGRTKLRSGCE